jgi:pyruvate/2-oxoglutarate dehydrogenase complex dihydrolipoamide dehydrogenase (E3) component
MTDPNTSPLFHPDTPENQELCKLVAPSDWVNPTPSGRYNLVVIGAGSGGLVSAAGAAGLGAKVALIEKHALGGDCLNVGCVPSKALLAAAKQAAAVRDAGDYHVHVPEGTRVDFPSVMNRMRTLRLSIAPNDSAERFRDLGIDVFIGEGIFTDGETVTVGGAELKFSKAVIATGARAIVIPIPGLKEAEPLTNETLFSLTELPKRLAVIGAGPIGCEMAQAFARFGSEVTLLETADTLLPREDPDAAGVVRAALQKDGVHSLCGVKVGKVEKTGDLRTLHYEENGETKSLEVDHILVGAGRAPNVEGIGLEKAGVEFDPRNGITIDDTLRTTNKRIFAVGDVSMTYKFTHVADFTARAVIQNALFGGRKKHTDLLVPWCTYTQPEIAHVGLYEPEALAQYGETLSTYRRDFANVDRTILEGHSDGFVKIHAVKGKIVGATIVGEHAGDLISEVSVAMRAGMKLGALASVIHPYPTAAEAIRQCGDAYNRDKLTPTVAKLFNWWLKKTR